MLVSTRTTYALIILPYVIASNLMQVDGPASHGVVQL